MAYPPDPISPTDVENDTPLEDTHPDLHDATTAAVNDIVSELGAGPKGAAASVTARLSTLDTTVAAKETPAGAQAKADAVAATASSALATHSADTTAVHGITDTSALETTTGAQAKANAAQAAAIAASQPVDSDLTAIAALSTTAYGRAFLALADAAAARTALALGTAATAASGDFDAAGAAAAAQAASQPLDSDLTAIAALTTTSFGRSLLAMADAAATKTALSLANVDNTSDANKPVSTAQAAADAVHPADTTAAHAASSVAFTPAGSIAATDVQAAIEEVAAEAGAGGVTDHGDLTGLSDDDHTQYAKKASNLSDLANAATARTNLSLGNVDNTSDANKPVSTAQQTALDLKAPLASPTLTGTPAAPTAAQGTDTTQVATTAYVQTEAGLLLPKSLVDAAGDLLVGTADNTVGRLAKGSALDVLRVNAGGTALEWAAPSGGASVTATTVELTADVTLTPADTMTDLGGMSMSLVAGTYLVSASVQFEGNVASSYALVHITTAANTLVYGAQGYVISPQKVPVVISPRVLVVGSTTTYKIRAQSAGTTNKVLKLANTVPGSWFTAVKIA